MSYYVTNENSFLDIKNAHLRVTGNVHTDVLKVGSIGFQPSGSNIPGTVNFTNVTTGVTTSSNLDVGGTLNLGTVELSASTHTLDHITARGNVTSTTVQFDNATTGLVTTANVEVGGELTVSSNIEVAGFVGTSGTGALTVPVGTTAQQPSTCVVGMIRYNTTSNRLEVYNGSAWQSIGGISATGGTVTTSGAYKIHTFTGDVNDTTFTVISGGEVEYLVVAGGGGGGTGNSGTSHEAGGGGAGGLLSGTIPYLPTGSYTAVVGGGGTHGTKGSDSSISFPTQITAEGGGQGGSGGGYGSANGGNGGSGGGGRNDTAGGNGTAGQGNNGSGGAVYRGSNGTYSNSGGGGGGAGQVGGANGVTDGGKGIEFTYYNHKGSPAGWFAGGGRGALVSSGTHPAWTAYGGGGNTETNTAVDVGTPGSGVINTGGGGCGSHRQFAASLVGGSGGSGIVIIRYLI